MDESQQTTNEEIMQAANALTVMGSDVAALLIGVHANNPDPPSPHDAELAQDEPAEVIWYTPLGVPDYAYGEALRIARAVNHAMRSTADMVERLSSYDRSHLLSTTAGR